MSNKAKTTTPKPDGKPALTPMLRFPEFRDAEGWASKALGGVCEILNNRRRPITSDQRVAGPYPYYGASGIVDFVGDFIFDERLLLVGEDGAKWEAFQKTAFIAEGKYWVNNHAHVLKPVDVSDTFLENYLTMADLGPFVTGAAPPKLALGKLKGIPVPVPPSTAEQQKIAECLSSVDELIATQARKLDALKTHKKGLMQQLFPREGETQPRLRFPEFQNAGEWEEKQLGDMCVLVRGPFGGSLKKEIFVASGYAVYEQSHAIYGHFTSFRYYISEQKYAELKRFSVKPGDLIMSCSGTMGKFAIVPPGASLGVINQALLKLSVKRGCIPGFLKEVLDLPSNQEQLLSQSAGGAIKNVVSVSQIKELELFIPGLAEQQKIVDCLSYLDDLIAAQTQKLVVLKTHKKGLMQQLFPSPVAVDA